MKWSAKLGSSKLIIDENEKIFNIKPRSAEIRILQAKSIKIKIKIPISTAKLVEIKIKMGCETKRNWKCDFFDNKICNLDQNWIGMCNVPHTPGWLLSCPMSFALILLVLKTVYMTIQSLLMVSLIIFFIPF